MVEGGTPNTLLRRGITRDTLTVGTEVIVDGYQTKDHSLKRANGRDVTFADGRKMFMGSSGTGAPRDGSDPTEGARAAEESRADDNRRMTARRYALLPLAVCLAAALTVGACGRSTSPGPADLGPPPAFGAFVDDFLEQFARMNPSIAAGNGLHQHDDTLEDFSAAGVAGQIATWRQLRTSLQAIPLEGLTADERVDHRIMAGLIDGWLLDLETVKSWQKNLMVYASAVSSGVHNLMTMESSPAEVRARRIIAKLAGVPALLAAADANLTDPPEVMAERGVRMFRGRPACCAPTCRWPSPASRTPP